MAAPQPRPENLNVELPDETATAALARDVAALVRRGDVIALAGELGSGKTSFARAFINSLPGPGGTALAALEEVPSPTFTLLQTYERAPAPVFHFDLYRLERPDDALELGLDEALADGITLIEWPERMGPLLPAERLELRLEIGATPDARRATLVGTGRWPLRLRGLGRHD